MNDITPRAIAQRQPSAVVRLMAATTFAAAVTCAFACTAESPPAKSTANSFPLANAPPAKGAATSSPTTAPVAAQPPAKERTATVDPLFEKLLNVHRASLPRAISGDEFLFLSDAPGTAQLFRQTSLEPSEGGKVSVGRKPEQLTSFSDRVSSFRAARGGTLAVVMRDSGGDENDQILRVDLEKAKPATITALTEKPKVKHSLPSFDDASRSIAFTSNARNGKDMDLYVESIAADPREFAKTPFVELAGSFTVADWRGDSILVVESRSEVDGDLWVIDAKNKTKRLLTKHAGAERNEGATFSRDGKAVFTLSDRGNETMQLVAIDVLTGSRGVVLKSTHDFTHLAAAHVRAEDATKAEGDVLAFAENVDGVESLNLVRLDGKRKATKRTATTLRGVIGSVDIAPSGAVAYVGFERADRPSEIFRIDMGTGKNSRVTVSDHAGLDESAFVGEELLTLTSSDKQPLSTFWYAKKATTGERLPVVMVIHGGPESQAQPTFSPVIQFLVAHGYAVATPNVRGSLGYGKSFAHLDDKHRREDAVRDLSEIGTFLAARSDVDPKRIVLYGGSYGGYMVLAGLTLYPDQWAAGVDVVGIANFRTFLEQTAPYRRALREAEYGSLANDGALLDRISPLHKVDKIKAPLFIVHGTRDPRVPVGEARQIHDALKSRGLPVELMTFDDEGHGLAKRKNRLVAYPAIVAFLDMTVKAKVAPTPSK